MSDITKPHLECGDAFCLYNSESNADSVCLNAPVSGRFISMADIPDPSFSAGDFGDCAAILTEDNVITAPCSGKIVAVARAKHGLGILNTEKGEIMIQVGLNTEKLCGEGFLPLVCEGDFVESGEKILQFDPGVLCVEGYQPLVIIVKMDE